MLRSLVAGGGALCAIGWIVAMKMIRFCCCCYEKVSVPRHYMSSGSGSMDMMELSLTFYHYYYYKQHYCSQKSISNDYKSDATPAFKTSNLEYLLKTNSQPTFLVNLYFAYYDHHYIYYYSHYYSQIFSNISFVFYPSSVDPFKNLYFYLYLFPSTPSYTAYFD
jgi:hypothetical protein